jgi:hypothetical protein
MCNAGLVEPSAQPHHAILMLPSFVKIGDSVAFLLLAGTVLN